MPKKAVLKFLPKAVGFLLVLLCGLVFSVTLVWESADNGKAGERKSIQEHLEEFLNEPAAEDGDILSLQARLVAETEEQVRMGGRECTVVTRTYETGYGTANARTAYPEAYVERLSAEGWEPQLLNGLIIGPLEATFATREGEGMLIARDGHRVYTIEMDGADEEPQRIWTLGVSAVLPGREEISE